MDLSYSYGSFKTHKTNINFGYTAKSGFTVQLNAFQNYSDNNHKVFASDILDVNKGTYNIHKKWVERFHDKYYNETALLIVGFVKKIWKDRFLIGATFGQEYADNQRANMMNIVYGKRFRTANTIMTSLTYEKNNLFVKGLNFKLSANYNRNNNHNNDTINRQYNWFGGFKTTVLAILLVVVNQITILKLLKLIVRMYKCFLVNMKMPLQKKLEIFVFLLMDMTLIVSTGISKRLLMVTVFVKYRMFQVTTFC